jgi:hypothetical protein
LRWLTQKTSGLLKQGVPNKNKLQGFLLGVGLFLRDHELACFTDYDETPVPGYVANSCMAGTDVDVILRAIQSIASALPHDSRYVYCYN